MDGHHTPHILDGNDPSVPTINASRRKQRRMGTRRGPRWREAGPRPARCQAMGGARARNSAACDVLRSKSAAASSRNRPKTAGSGNDGISAGTNAPARWVSVQIGQWSSAGCSRPAGLEGALKSSGDGGAPASALAPAESGAMRSRCTWPNETASWNASANSARYAPNLERDRNQFIVVTLHASRTRQNHSAGPVERLSNSVTLPQLGQAAAQARFSWRVAKNQHCRRRTSTLPLPSARRHSGPIGGKNLIQVKALPWTLRDPTRWRTDLGLIDLGLIDLGDDRRGGEGGSTIQELENHASSLRHARARAYRHRGRALRRPRELQRPVAVVSDPRRMQRRR